MAKTKPALTPVGVSDWTFSDPQFSQVREYTDLGDEIKAYLAANSDKPEEGFEETLLGLRWRRIAWLFENIVRSATGEKLPGMDSREAFEKLGWNQLRDLEAAANAFLFDPRPVPTS